MPGSTAGKDARRHGAEAKRRLSLFGEAGVGLDPGDADLG
jgi:hypothetical protein